MTAIPQAFVNLYEERRQALSKTVRTHQRELHEIPEIGFQEHETSSYLARALTSLGVKFEQGIAGTGVVASIGGERPGPTIMIRADMDGLPIEEDASHAPRSTHDGRMHACGHDGHMAIALSVCRALKEAFDRELLPGKVVTLFQPAEEGGPHEQTGAQRMVAEGVLERYGIDAVLGLHLWSFEALGTAIVPDRTVLASTDEFFIVFEGQGGHAALPHRAKDPLLAASEAVVALQSIVSRNVDPADPAVVTVGSFHAGTASNIIPQQAELRGTMRAPNEEVRELLKRRVAEVANSVAAAHGITANVEIGLGYPATVNAPPVAAVMRDRARDVLGPAKVFDGPPTMAGEDFSFFLQQRPGAFMLLGMRDESSGAVYPHHHPSFRIVPEAMDSGVEIMTRTVVDLLHRPDVLGS